MSDLELGHLIYGNPAGAYDTPEYVDALIEALLCEIGRIYWNNNQEQWERFGDVKMEGVEFRSYYWGDNEEIAAMPNLKFSHSEQEIRWYKHPGRGQTSTLEMTEKEWVVWFDEALAIIRKNEKELY